MNPGKLIVLTGPSGVGKGTLLRSLRQRHPELYLSISTTTRPPRLGEVDAQDYYFVSRTQFEQMIAEGKLLEWAEYTGNYYGTPRQPVENQIQQDRSVVLEIELKGARQIRQSVPEALQIFIMPPSVSELERRIRNRGQDSQVAIARRLARAREEMSAANEFDLQIVNDDFNKALASIEAAIFQPVNVEP